MPTVLISTLNAHGHEAIMIGLNLTLQSLLLTMALLLADRLFRNRIRTAVRYALWMLVLVRLFLPPTLLSPTSLAYWLGPRLAHSRGRLSNPEWRMTQQESVADTTTNAIPWTFPPVGRTTLNFPAALLLGWLGGAIALLGWVWRRQRRVAELVRTGARGTIELQALLRAAADDLGLRRIPELRLSAVSHSPALCGLWRPVILVSANLELAPTAWRAVFLHELIHFQRRDVWTNALQVFTQWVWWWNPLVWWVNARIRHLRETAVDEAVMLATNPETSDYPGTLVAIARHCLVRTTFTLNFLGIVESPSRLELRIRRLLEKPLPGTAQLGWRGWLIVFATAAGVLPMGFGPRTEAAAPPLPGISAAKPDRVIQQLNPSPPQVLLESHFLEADLGLIAGLNLAWESSTENVPHTNAARLARLTAAQGAALIAGAQATAGFELLSSPKVTTLSDRQASVSVTEMRTIVTGQSNSIDGPIELTLQLPTGPGVDLIAVCDPKDPTLLRVKATSWVVEFLGYQAAKTPIPLIRTNEARGEAWLRDGQMMVLQMPPFTNIVQLTSRVPYLSDIPGIGRFFTSQRPGTVVRQRLVFITPMLINGFGQRINDPQHTLFDPTKLP